METLRVRVYNVRFGDAILICVPDQDASGQTTMRHIVIDVGNAQATAGGVNTVFKPVIEDILSELNGQPLDLYIMTHEHMDHVQGLPWAAEKVYTSGDLPAKLRPRDAWFTASADPKYYDTHPDAKRKFDDARALMDDIRLYLEAAPNAEAERIQGLLAINDYGSTRKCVDFLRGLAGPDHTWYIHRESNLAGKHSFQEVQFEIWAPEEDTGAYYRRQPRIALGVIPPTKPKRNPDLTVSTPPPGVDAGAFYDLLAMRRSSYLDSMLAIDKAANDTCVVFCLSWRGWRLLFPGDAESGSWRMIRENIPLDSVDFLKVSHHGSATGMPPAAVLDKLLPPDGVARYVAVSTYPEAGAPKEAFTHDGVPDSVTLQRLEERARLSTVLGLADGGYVDFDFEAWSQNVTVTRC